MKKVFVFIVPMLITAEVLFAAGLFEGIGRLYSREAKERIVLQETHLLFKDGKIYKVENNEPKELQKEIQLNNGTVVYPDGTYELKDKRRYALSDGECLDMNGSHYLNQRMLNQKRPMSADELQKSRSQYGDKGGRAKQ